MRYWLTALLCFAPFQAILAASLDPSIVYDLIPGDAPEASEVRDLITKLGDKQYAVRQEALKKLHDLGPRLLKSPLLEELGLKSSDPHIGITCDRLKSELAFPFTRISDKEAFWVLHFRLALWIHKAFEEMRESAKFFDIVDKNFTSPNIELVKTQIAAVKDRPYDGQYELTLKGDPENKWHLGSVEDLSQKLHDLYSAYLERELHFREEKPSYPYFHYTSAGNKIWRYVDLVCNRNSSASISLRGPWEVISLSKILSEGKKVPLVALLDSSSFVKNLRNVSFQWQLSNIKLDSDELFIHFSIYVNWKKDPHHVSEYIFDPWQADGQMQVALQNMINIHK